MFKILMNLQNILKKKSKSVSNRVTIVIFITTLILINFITHLPWLNPWLILTHGDWQYSATEVLNTLRINYFSMWLSDKSLGRVLLDVGQAPTYSLYGFFSKYFGLGFEFGSRLVHFWPILIVTPIGSFLLLQRLTKNLFASLVGTIILLFNTYFLMLQTGHLTLAGAYTWLPIFLYFFDKKLTEPRIRYTSISAVLLAIITSYEPRLAYIVFIIIGIYSLFIFFKSSTKVLIFRQLALFFFQYILLNLYWIIGLITSNTSSNNTLFNRTLWGSAFFSLTQSLTIYHSFWTGGKLDIFGVNYPPFYHWIIPIVFFICLIYGFNKSIYIKIFGIVGLIGIILTKQEDIPFRDLYKWLFENFPGFKAFREASKFYVLTVFGYSVTISVGISLMLSKSATIKLQSTKFLSRLIANLSFQLGRVKKPFAYISGLLLIFIMLLNNIPLINGSIGTTFIPRTMPDEYKLLNQFIKEQPDYFRTLWYPHDSRWFDYSYNHPLVVASDIVNYQLKQLYESNNFYNDRDLESQYDIIFNTNFSKSNLDIMSVKYIVVPSIDTDNDDNGYIHQTRRDDYATEQFDYNEFKETFVNKLRKASYLNEIKFGSEKISIFENKNYNPYFSLVDEVSTINNTNIVPKNNFINETLQKPFNYQVNKDKKIGESIELLFEDSLFDQQNLKPLEKIKTDGKTLYIKNKHQLVINKSEESLEVFAHPMINDFVNVKDLKKVPDTYIFKTKLEPGYTYEIKINDRVTELKDPKQIILSIEQELTKIELILTKDGVQKVDEQILQLSTLNEQNVIDSSRFDNSLEYINPISSSNLIENGSFEAGTWEEKVGNCNYYDDNPILSQRIVNNNMSRNQTVLELSARRHTACTTKKISIQETQDYLLNLDYNVVNGEDAGINIGFDDPNKININKRLKKDTKWNQNKYLFEAPLDAKNAFITLYGFAADSDGIDTGVVMYDNVTMKQVPKYSDFAYLVNKKPENEINGKVIIEVKANTQTEKNIKIKNIKNPTHLIMSERYNSNWKLNINNKMFLDEDLHFELNELMNGWYIDPNKLCKPKICERNPDGTFNINLIINFEPQKWMNIGLVISGITLNIILLILAYLSLPKRFQKLPFVKLRSDKSNLKEVIGSNQTPTTITESFDQMLANNKAKAMM